MVFKRMKRLVAGLATAALAVPALFIGATSAQAADGGFPDVKYFSTEVENLNLTSQASPDAPAFMYGFSGWDSPNVSVPVYADAQLEQANRYMAQHAAYCMDVDLPAPGDNWTGKNVVRVAQEGNGWHAFKYVTNPSVVKYVKAGQETGAVAWIAAHGYPHSAGGAHPYLKPLDDPDARSVTQLALWIAKGQVRTEGGSGRYAQTRAVSTADGHQVAGGNYSAGGQENFRPYTMIGLAQALADKAKSAPDKDRYVATYYRAENGTALQRMLFASRVPEANRPGRITLSKQSLKPSYSDNNNAYSMDGIEYTVYTDQACTQRYKNAVIRLNAQGVGNAIDVPANDVNKDYFIKETKTNQGYEMNTKVYKVRVGSGQIVEVK